MRARAQAGQPAGPPGGREGGGEDGKKEGFVGSAGFPVFKKMYLKSSQALHIFHYLKKENKKQKKWDLTLTLQRCVG